MIFQMPDFSSALIVALPNVFKESTFLRSGLVGNSGLIRISMVSKLGEGVEWDPDERLLFHCRRIMQMGDFRNQIEIDIFE